MQQYVKILVLDLDGTVFDNGYLSIEEIRNIRKLSQTGVRIIISTGRTLHYVLGITRSLGIKDVIICEEGTILYDCQTHTRQVFGDLSDINILKQNLSEWLPICCIPKEAHHDKQIILALDRNPRGNLDDFVEEVRSILIEKNLNLNITRSDEMINIMPPGINKGSTLRKFLNDEKINPDSVVAIGDSLNDLSVFELVGFSVAVRNATDKLKQHADFICTKDNGLGVCEVIDMILANNMKYV